MEGFISNGHYFAVYDGYYIFLLKKNIIER